MKLKDKKEWQVKKTQNDDSESRFKWIDKEEKLKFNWDELEIWQKNPFFIKKSSDNKNRLIYTDYESNYVFDMQMVLEAAGQGKNFYLKPYTRQDIKDRNALGLQKIAFVRHADLISPNFISFMLGDQEARWQKNSMIIEELYGELKTTSFTKFPYVIPVPQDLQSISLVSFETAQEFPLVKQRTICMYEKLTEPWITFDKDIVTLDYFESYYDQHNSIKESHYTTFELTDDFLQTIVSCGEIIPSDKSKLVSHLSELQSDTKQLKIIKKD